MTDQHSAQIRGKVVYLQPKAERWREANAGVHIVTRDWLDPYRYEAVYVTPVQSFAGTYTIVRYSDAEGKWLFMGVFERATDGEISSMI